MTGAVAGLAAVLWMQGAGLGGADRLYAEGRYWEAAEAYRGLLEQNPDHPALLARLGAALAAGGQPDKAIPYLEKADQVSPGNRAVLLALSQAYYAAGRFRPAARLFRALLEKAPDDVSLLVRLGACEYQLGGLMDAEEAFRRAVAVKPDHVQGLVGLGMALNGQGRAAEAMPLLERAVALAPTDRMARRALAHAYTEQGEFAKGEKLLEDLLREDPADWEAWFYLGALLSAQAYYGPALDALERSLKLRPETPRARILRLRALANLGRLEEAGALYERLSKEPAMADDADFLLGHAEFCFLASRLEEALARIDAAIVRRPRQASLYYWKARILLHMSRPAEAEPEAERAVRLDPAFRHPRSLLVRIYRLQGKEKEAAEQVEWLRRQERAVALGQGR